MFKRAFLWEYEKEQMKLKGDLISEVLNQIGFDALGVGEKDLSLGIDYLLEKQETEGLPFICTNLVHRKNADPVFQTDIVKAVNGLNVCLMSLLDPSQLLPDLLTQEDTTCAN